MRSLPPPEQNLLSEVERFRRQLERPIVVALDGGSGAGKTTIAQRFTRLTKVAVVPLDDFYQTVIPEAEWPRKTVPERLAGVFDWSRVRAEAIEPLRARRPGRWHAFDFMRGLGKTGTYSLKDEVTEVGPAPTVLLEGAYSASPPLRDLIDIAVLVDVHSQAGRLRTVARERDPDDFLSKWHAIWDDVETYYFQNVCPPESFDLIIRNDDDPTTRTLA